MSDRLFDDGPITSTLADQRRKALAAVEELPPDALLARPLDDLVEAVMGDYRIRPLIIEWDRKTVDATEAQIELDAGGTATGTRVDVLHPLLWEPRALPSAPDSAS